MHLACAAAVAALDQCCGCSFILFSHKDPHAMPAAHTSPLPRCHASIPASHMIPIATVTLAAQPNTEHQDTRHHPKRLRHMHASLIHYKTQAPAAPVLLPQTQSSLLNHCCANPANAEGDTAAQAHPARVTGHSSRQRLRPILITAAPTCSQGFAGPKPHTSQQQQQQRQQHN